MYVYLRPNAININFMPGPAKGVNDSESYNEKKKLILCNAYVEHSNCLHYPSLISLHGCSYDILMLQLHAHLGFNPG